MVILATGFLTKTSDAGAETVLLDVVALKSHEYGSICETLAVELAMVLVDTFALMGEGEE